MASEDEDETQLISQPRSSNTHLRDYFLSVQALFAKHRTEGLPFPDVHQMKRLNFPQKLYLMIEYDDSHSIEWILDGFAFIILDEAKLKEQMLLKYFRSNDMQTFKAKLHSYGFIRLAFSTLTFKHPKFLRGQIISLLEINRAPPSCKIKQINAVKLKRKGDETREEYEAKRRKVDSTDSPIQVDDDESSVEMILQEENEKIVSETENEPQEATLRRGRRVKPTLTQARETFFAVKALFDERKKSGLPPGELPRTPLFPFPQRLYLVLEYDDTGSIQWSSDGSSFTILDKKRFMEDVSPKYFRHSSYASFYNQLKTYGFKFLNSLSYQHLSFRKNEIDAMLGILIQKTTSSEDTPANSFAVKPLHDDKNKSDNDDDTESDGEGMTGEDESTSNNASSAADHYSKDTSILNLLNGSRVLQTESEPDKHRESFFCASSFPTVSLRKANRVRLNPTEARESFYAVKALFDERKKSRLSLYEVSTWLTQIRFFPFPQRLYLVLEYDDTGSIQWSSDGSSFTILDKKRFMEDVCPKYFRQSSFPSFYSQLRAYGFRSKSTSKYGHPSFRRNEIDGLLGMRPTSSKASATKNQNTLCIVNSINSIDDNYDNESGNEDIGVVDESTTAMTVHDNISTVNYQKATEKVDLVDLRTRIQLYLSTSQSQAALKRLLLFNTDKLFQAMLSDLYQVIPMKSPLLHLNTKFKKMSSTNRQSYWLSEVMQEVIAMIHTEYDKMANSVNLPKFSLVAAAKGFTDFIAMYFIGSNLASAIFEATSSKEELCVVKSSASLRSDSFEVGNQALLRWANLRIYLITERLTLSSWLRSLGDYEESQISVFEILLRGNIVGEENLCLLHCLSIVIESEIVSTTTSVLVDNEECDDISCPAIQEWIAIRDSLASRVGLTREDRLMTTVGENSSSVLWGPNRLENLRKEILNDLLQNGDFRGSSRLTSYSSKVINLRIKFVGFVSGLHIVLSNIIHWLREPSVLKSLLYFETVTKEVTHESQRSDSKMMPSVVPFVIALCRRSDRTENITTGHFF